MPSRYDQFDDIDDFDFADTMTVDRILRMERREQRRSRPRRGRTFRNGEDVEPELFEFDGPQDIEGFFDYDADEFDRYQEYGTRQ